MSFAKLDPVPVNKIIINLAMTGWAPTRTQSVHVPMNVAEIVADACAGVACGASILHVHAREDNGDPSYNAERYGAIIRGIRAIHPQAIITVTTSGRRTADLLQRTAALRIQGADKPDMASLTLGSMNFADGASVNDPATIQALAGMMRECGVKPELEVFDLGMIHYAKVLIRKGLIDPPYYFNFILGNIATAQTDLLHLAVLLRELPPDSVWALGGIGRYQQTANNLAAVMADGARTGLEDNLWLDEARTQLATNAQLIRRVAEVARAAGREIATPEETRQRLGMDLIS
ncbi:MAG: 3-keto-5-aminohexanoate cleavage protein [Thiobacillus sp.]